MRKLFILKTIVDIIWIVSLPIILCILFIVPYLFISSDLSIIPIKINKVTLTSITLTGKFIFSIMTLSYLLVMYAIYLFRKILEMFMRTKIFDKTVLHNLNKIGNLLIVFSIINITCIFIYNLSSGEIKIELGISPLIITLCLGLFFMVLSEIFKIAKNAKDENELTI